MARNILRPFDHCPEEGAIVGRILAGYGAIQHELCMCVCAAIDDKALRVGPRIIFRLRGESARIDVADALMRPKFQDADLVRQYEEALGALRWCKKLRNQYAHAHWYYEDEGGSFLEDEGLYFYDMEKGARSASGEVPLAFVPVDLDLLQEQADYVGYCHDWLHYLCEEFRLRKGEIASHTSTAPQIIPQPPLYTPLEEYECPPTDPDDG